MTPLIDSLGGDRSMGGRTWGWTGLHNRYHCLWSTPTDLCTSPSLVTLVWEWTTCQNLKCPHSYGAWFAPQRGTGEGQFGELSDAQTDPVFVTDQVNRCVSLFRRNGIFRSVVRWRSASSSSLGLIKYSTWTVTQELNRNGALQTGKCYFLR